MKACRITGTLFCGNSLGWAQNNAGYWELDVVGEVPLNIAVYFQTMVCTVTRLSFLDR